METLRLREIVYVVQGQGAVKDTMEHSMKELPKIELS